MAGEGDAVKFIAGVVAGFALGITAGVAAVVAFAVGSDQDVREVFAKARQNMNSVDFDEVGAQVQQTIADVGAQVQETVTKAKAKTEAVGANGAETISNGAEAVTDAIAETEPVASA
jgi:gas vesicle protein